MRDQPFSFTKEDERPARTVNLYKYQLNYMPSNVALEHFSTVQGAIIIPQDLSVAEAHLFTNQLFDLKRNPVLGVTHGVQNIPVFAMRSHFSVERPPKNVTTTRRTFFDQENRMFNTDDGDHEVAPYTTSP
ncbi:hypothetical protein PG987_005164 [Apiospora arundinis]